MDYDFQRVPSDEAIDILSGVFYFFPNQKKFKYDIFEFKEFFSKQKSNFNILEKINIKTGQSYLRDDDLTNAMNRMIFWRQDIEAVNNWKNYFITDNCKNYFEKIKNSFSVKKLNQLEQLSLMFQEKFSL